MAFMEALSNALFNADYYKEGGVNISLYNEEVVFENAGSFVIDLNSVKTGGISDTRNAYLSQIFNFAGVGESVGGGIPKIYSLLNRNGLSAPKFSEQFNPDKIVLTLPLIKKQSIKLEVICLNTDDLFCCFNIFILIELQCFTPVQSEFCLN